MDKNDNRKKINYGKKKKKIKVYYINNSYIDINITYNENMFSK